MTVLRFTKDQLIDALEERRPWAERTDAERLAEHKKAEKEYLAAFRAAAREAAKWDYETAKKHRFSLDGASDFTKRNSPRCPESRVMQLDRQLSYIRASRQKQFAISGRGTWDRIFHLLTHDDDVPAEMC